MAKVTACDCCGSTTSVTSAVMTRDGIDAPQPRPRQDGLVHTNAIDLCVSCLTALAFKWNEMAEVSRG